MPDKNSFAFLWSSYFSSFVIFFFLGTTMVLFFSPPPLNIPVTLCIYQFKKISWGYPPLDVLLFVRRLGRMLRQDVDCVRFFSFVVGGGGVGLCALLLARGCGNLAV